MTTVSNEANREELIMLYSDFHKEAYGFRPRYNYRSYTLEQLEADYSRFSAQCDQNEINERENAKEAEQDFLNLIQRFINMGASDFMSALNWLVNGYDQHEIAFYGSSYIIYDLGLSGGTMAKPLEKLIKQILDRKFN